MASRRTFASSPQLRAGQMNPHVVGAQYAVRGELVIKAEKLQKELSSGNSKLPFEKIVLCNIGNPQQLGQQPVTFVRQLLALLQYPQLIQDAPNMFPADVVARAQELLKSAHPGGIGAYTNSKGFPLVRKHIAEFIERRDGGVPADPDTIYMYNGASPAVQDALRLTIRGPNDGVMIPIPQYPLYSASISILNGKQVGYELNEEAGWGMSAANLEKTLKQAQAQGTNVRALAIINPGNPTGQVLDEKNMMEALQFCRENNLILLADEVYQENVYTEKKKFLSFKSIRAKGKFDDVQLMSFHSISKGFFGECGQRGGYMEAVGFDQDVHEQLYKLASVCLCSNTSGQAVLSAMVNPPKPGDASYDKYKAERGEILASLGRRSRKIVAFLNTLEGVTCNESEGAMYAFPQIRLSEKAVQAARAAGKVPDAFYSLALLDATGVCVVPGSGFGQKDGTFHFRTTFLPSEKDIDNVLKLYSKFHSDFVAKYPF